MATTKKNKKVQPVEQEIKKYYSLKRILKEEADYNFIFGERSNGKTYSVEDYALEDFALHGNQLGIVRRWDEDFRGKRGQEMFSALVNNGLVEKYTKGKWTGIYYYSARWYLCKYENDKRVIDSEPFAYAFSINAMEHDKSTSYPKIKTILFDECMTREGYIPNEFVIFMNIVSTIVRDRGDVKIFMLGNTVDQHCIYFKEFGLRNALKMKQGDIDVYRYGDNELKVAIEYCATTNKNKKSNKYFAFNNPKLEMIKNGAWETSFYPHLPVKYKRDEILFEYFIVYDEHVLHCNIVQHDELLFTYIHRKSTPLKMDYASIVYMQEYSAHPCVRRRITKPFDDVGKKILWFFKTERVFYQDNDVGELTRAYLKWSESDRGIM